MTQRPKVIAHRGSNSTIAEHTLAAYERAIAEGADGLECDVRLTADGVAVCVHDRTIQRTSDGAGIVSIKTYNELSQRDFGLYQVDPHGAVSEDNDPGAHRLLTLDELLELVVATPRRLELAIETKHPVRYGALVEERVTSTLARFGLIAPKPDEESTIRIMSFSEIALRRVRAMAPALPIVFLVDRVPLRSRRSAWLPARANIVGPSIALIREHPDFVRKMHAAGHDVHVWIVDSPDDVGLCLDLEVEAIISNKPGQVIEVLNSVYGD